MSLSDKIFFNDVSGLVLHDIHVKQAVKELKELLKGDNHYDWTIQEIDKIFGKDLI